MTPNKKTKEAKQDSESTIDVLMESLKSRFGEGAVMQLGDEQRVKVDTIPSGSFSLDLALGAGGLPKGRVIEIYGPESSGMPRMVGKRNAKKARTRTTTPMRITTFLLIGEIAKRFGGSSSRFPERRTVSLSSR